MRSPPAARVVLTHLRELQKVADLAHLLVFFFSFFFVHLCHRLVFLFSFVLSLLLFVFFLIIFSPRQIPIDMWGSQPEALQTTFAIPAATIVYEDIFQFVLPLPSSIQFPPHQR